MTDHLVLVCHSLSRDDTNWLRAQLECRWPGEQFRVISAESVRPEDLRQKWLAQVGPSEYKTVTPVPEWEELEF